jgi:hypothetical protein
MLDRNANRRYPATSRARRLFFSILNGSGDLHVRIAIATVAFIAGLIAFLVVCGGGLVLLLVPGSGERLAGAFLALLGCLAFGALLLLVFARTDFFHRSGGVAAVVIATLLAVVPVAGLAGGALVFAGVPFGSAVPLLDWGAFAAGIGFAIGALAIVVLGWSRLWRPRQDVAVPQPVEHRPARLQLQDAFEHRRASIRANRDDDVRVTRV